MLTIFGRAMMVQLMGRSSRPTFYYAACHDAIVKSPYSSDNHRLPQRLGYRFPHTENGSDQDNVAPRDMLNSVSAHAVEDFPTGSPATIVSAMAHEETDPNGNELKHKANRKAYFSTALQAYEKHMKPDDWQDFDADDFTGTQDLTGVSVKSVTQTKRGDDIEIIVAYGNDDAKDEHGKPYPPFKVGYIMVQDRKSAWKIDDFIYDKIEGVTPERSFRAMYTHP